MNDTDSVTGGGARPMTVGELSRRTGVPIKALREYADTGLVYTTGRTATGYRQFDQTALWCVHWIATLRGLGLTLSQIRELATTHTCHPDWPIGPELARYLRAARDRTQSRITELQQTLHRIDAFETRYQVGLSGHGELDGHVIDHHAGTGGVDPPPGDRPYGQGNGR
jgi:DNA-binding transcriptional MerR regulator